MREHKTRARVRQPERVHAAPNSPASLAAALHQDGCWRTRRFGYGVIDACPLCGHG
jgi:hypothetical protein